MGYPVSDFRKGGKAAQWKDEEMAEIVFGQGQKQFVNDHKDAPFFSLLRITSTTRTRVPNERFM